MCSSDLPPFDTAGQQDRVGDERIVEAVCEGAQLRVQRLDRTGRRERLLPWSDAASFPLLARVRARARQTASGPCTLFDPASEELVERSYDSGRLRALVVDGVRSQVTELTEVSSTGRNTEWVDANARIVRREIAGPALVAVQIGRAHV